MKLKVLLQALGGCEIRGSDDIDIGNICYNSKTAGAGSLFAAIPGFSTDGRKYIPDAVKAGAVAVVFEGAFFENLRAVQIRVSGARLALARMADVFFAHPTEHLYLAGVTGTNGKTTLSYLMEALWQASGTKAGIVGTVNARFGPAVFPANQTTPESPDLQFLFSEMKKSGVKCVCMEVSSHAVQLSRIERCRFDSCVFTNLSHDHLDFHGTMDEYYKIKEKLFLSHLEESPKKKKLAVVCREDAYGRRLLKKLGQSGMESLSYGFDSSNDVYPECCEIKPAGLKARVKCGKNVLEIDSELFGKFNLLNILAAVTLGFHSGLSQREIEEGIKNLNLVPGRLEKIFDPVGRIIFVDYAHTPSALKNVLEELKSTVAGSHRIITVFGCGGDRDRAKRPLMGFEAARLSDVCIVTSDNPRTEDPGKIISDILPGVKKCRGEFLVEEDRKAAIAKALGLAKAGDVVLIAGKGHEDYQIIGKTRHPFSDQETVREILGKCI